MPLCLLTGAGFSRNWGGWLADEAFEYLLGCADITPLIKTELWKAKGNGSGFEGALNALRASYITHRDERHRIELKTFEQMLLGMFTTMNNAFSKIEFEPGVEHARLGPQPTRVRDFLCRFDKIFTLNQDTLLEQKYEKGDLRTGSEGRWFQLGLPGIREMKMSAPPHTHPGLYAPASPPFTISERLQPYFKLHGSSNWRTDDGSNLLIMGGNKSALISESPLLSWYMGEFRKSLKEPGTRLMVIGYGFGDPHVNGYIREGVEAGTKLFIIDPQGIDVIRNPLTQNVYNFGDSLQAGFIGASRRDFRTSLLHDDVELSKITRFFGP